MGWLAPVAAIDGSTFKAVNNRDRNWFGNFVPVITCLIALAQGRRLATLKLMGAAIVLPALIANNLHQRSKLGRIEA